MSFDVIIVGGGTSGAALASRLSEDTNRKVLLLEAGSAPKSRDEYKADLLDGLLLTGAMPGHPNNWSFHGHLTPQMSYTISRGKILGGTSSLNGVYFVRPRRIDLERWSADGNTAWSPETVLPVMKRMENDLTYGRSDIHGDGGPMPVYREVNNPSKHTKAFYAAAKSLGFKEVPDKNDIDILDGYGPMPRNSLNGTRFNTGLAYIIPIQAHRPNLTVQGNTYVHRILLDRNRAVGVVVERDGIVEEIRGGEVILAAGAIKSPHILLLSGIGSALDLAKAEIDTKVDLPGVGKDFTDHVDAPINWKPSRALRQDDRNLRQLFEATLNWTAEGSHTPSDLEIFPMLRSFDKAMGGVINAMAARPIRSVLSLNGVSLIRLTGQLLRATDLSFQVLLNQPDARGNMTITSSNPHKQPRLDYNYLSVQRDLVRFREGLRTGAKLLRSAPFSDLCVKMTELNDSILDNDSALDKWSKKNLSLAIHLTGTAKMGSDRIPTSVVDQYGRVHGVKGLRVADLSILPYSPTRAPAASAVLVGEMMADLVKNGPSSHE